VRNAGRRVRPQPHAQNKQAHELATTKAPDTSGVPHAVGFRLASCSPRQRSKPDAVVSAVLRAFGRRRAKSSPDFAGPHDLGRRARAMPMGHISAPVRTAQRGRSPDLGSLTRLRLLNAPFVQGARSRSGLAPCDPRSGPTLPRPPHPAPRTVTIAKRPSHRDGMNRNIYPKLGNVNRIASPEHDQIVLKQRFGVSSVV